MIITGLLEKAVTRGSTDHFSKTISSCNCKLWYTTLIFEYDLNSVKKKGMFLESFLYNLLALLCFTFFDALELVPCDKRVTATDLIEQGLTSH